MLLLKTEKGSSCGQRQDSLMPLSGCQKHVGESDIYLGALRGGINWENNGQVEILGEVQKSMYEITMISAEQVTFKAIQIVFR